MSYIKVNTEQLLDASNQLKTSHNELAQVQDVISASLSGVSNAYDGQLRQSISTIVGGSDQVVARMEMRAIELMEELLSRAKAFAAANIASQKMAVEISNRFVGFLETTPNMAFLTFFSRWNQKALAIWGMAGLGFGGLASLFFVSAKPEIPTLLGTTSKPSVTFGDLLKKSEEERLLKERQEVQRREWWKANGLNQIAPGVFEAMKSYGNAYNACGATTLAMLINYSNFTNNQASQKADPASLVKWAGQQGYLSDKLLSFRELEQIADHQGFALGSSLKNDGSSPMKFEDLKSQVRAGTPHIVLAKYGYDAKRNYVPDATAKFDHFVIVTDISDSQVTIVNPHPGINKTQDIDVAPTNISVDEFKKIWASDSNKSIGQGFGIRPK